MYEHGERIWLRETSEGDAERVAIVFQCTMGISILSDIVVRRLLAIAIDC